MKKRLAFVFALFFAGSGWASDAALTDEDSVFVDTDTTDLSQFVWLKRPVIVFADSPNDPRFIQQLEYLTAREDALRERDVVVLTDTDPAAQGPLRLKLRPRGFMLVLIGKDGGVKQRKPFPWDVREIGRSIDKMPMRQREIRDRTATDDGS